MEEMLEELLKYQENEKNQSNSQPKKKTNQF